MDALPERGADAALASPSSASDLLCLSHLRWDFVFQRPQQLMTRLARDRRVFFFEEPVFGDANDGIQGRRVHPSLAVLVPHLRGDASAGDVTARLQVAIDNVVEAFAIRDVVLWYWTPMALPFTRHLQARTIVFDCMDELSAFAGAPPQLLQLEAELLQRASIVFTGGQSLFEAKRSRHPNVHLFPSSVDVPHFAQARSIEVDPPDQAAIPHPRLGYFGVVDERMDLDLVGGAAQCRPDWHFVFVGPTAKIDPEQLPQARNIHYLGMKGYDALPAYLAGWDVALLPFARNEATRFISPTKTPEYLAAGCPVVSTSIRDVVRPYGQMGLVRVADTPAEFVNACEAALRESRADRLRRVDEFLAGVSWDLTCSRMDALIRHHQLAVADAPATRSGAAARAAASSKGSPNAIPSI